jgi:hypothetical protein
MQRQRGATCPFCGSPETAKADHQPFLALVPWRVCSACGGTFQRVPPKWMAILFIVVGGGSLPFTAYFCLLVAAFVSPGSAAGMINCGAPLVFLALSICFLCVGIGGLIRRRNVNHATGGFPVVSPPDSTAVK